MIAPADAVRDSGGFPVVGIGASAGGLEACRKLLDAMPENHGLALILVQHLDPNHASMLAELLANNTATKVLQATEGMTIEPDHLYVIPPGAYLAVGDGCLRLSRPPDRQGVRLSFDHLLHSMAEEYGARAVCIILSGTGTDGSAGAKAIRAKGGRVIAQNPREAAYDGMPRNAITAGVVDQVLDTVRMPDALARLRSHPVPPADPEDGPSTEAAAGDKPATDGAPWLTDIIELLRANAGHDFSLYKQGTLKRRIERRMALSALRPTDTPRYLERLRGDRVELELLARDLLINVTGFFRDPAVFEHLAETAIPELVDDRSPESPLRIWSAGCSTGEEVYSLAMLFLECIAKRRRSVKLQVFASDVDADAVTCAREGLYPASIADDVSPDRLERFFIAEDHHYRVRPELRACVVFTVQDVLNDPPFSRLDMISCRNLMIYLRPEAQARVTSVFHFALREGGVLLLGGAETINTSNKRFEVISKPNRLYRHIAPIRPGETDFSIGLAPGTHALAPTGPVRGQTRQGALAELCRQLVLEHHAPAAILINDRNEVLYSLGPVERYLRVAPGHPSHDLLAMAGVAIRNKLRSAIHQATQQNGRVVIAGGSIETGGATVSFAIDVLPLTHGSERRLLICFIETIAPARRPPDHAGNDPQVAELERELADTRAELLGAIRNLERASQDQKAISEETLSANEEFQATNEELLTSKEELQSLNEELTALNGQLQETLERQRTTANDLQNVLYSTDVATLFLDNELNIRFFTPTTRALFNVIPTDIGRKLGDLRSATNDDALLGDAARVLGGEASIEREIEAPGDAWFIRRVMPYRTREGEVGGVVITFTDISERRRTAHALAEAKLHAEQANRAKSRFLAAASHDLRQPLQTLALIQGMLVRQAQGEESRDLIARLGQTLDAMSGMLNTLLDINQIEAGTVHAELEDFVIGDLLARLGDEFAYRATAQGLALRAVKSSLPIRSDPHLLEQMLRNLLANALKYTAHGKILLGCRRHGETLRIEVWDTGIGIPEAELLAIFAEYHQVDNAAREYSRGLGLGLSIVQRLAGLLGHKVTVRSWPGKGSVFAIEAVLPTETRLRSSPVRLGENRGAKHRTGSILIVEDDPEMRLLLDRFLIAEGHRTETARDGAAALRLVARERFRPDLILTDYNLPGHINGLQLISALRQRSARSLPAIVLTGDVSTDALHAIAGEDCIPFNKPVQPEELSGAIQRLLAAPHSRPVPETPAQPSSICIVDDDPGVREALRMVLTEAGRAVTGFASGEAFLDALRPGFAVCVLLDVDLPGIGGLDLLAHLNEVGYRMPVIMITGGKDVSAAVRAMKAGAVDFIEKPVGAAPLLAVIDRALDQAGNAAGHAALRDQAVGRLAVLTGRQRMIMNRVLAGQSSKVIAADLAISRRTVEAHRAAIMDKTGAASLPELARVALAASWTEEGVP
ncbi:MAG: chemotaxis protein CheB [Acidiphilium sp.]